VHDHGDHAHFQAADRIPVITGTRVTPKSHTRSRSPPWFRKAWRWRTRSGHWRRDLERVMVDTTVQPKAIAHPTAARLCHRALEKLVDLATRNHVPLRQNYVRLAKPPGDHGRALHPRPPVQTSAARTQIPAHPVGPGDPRHSPQDRRQPAAQRALCRAARAGAPGALSGPPPARTKGLRCMRPEVWRSSPCPSASGLSKIPSSLTSRTTIWRKPPSS
jgi:hypothetical protein